MAGHLKKRTKHRSHLTAAQKRKFPNLAKGAAKFHKAVGGGTHIKAPVSRKKAGQILKEGRARGKKLTKAQKGLFGAIRGGTFGHPKRKKRSRKK